MPDLRVGTVVRWHNLSPILATFRLKPEDGSQFPAYQPGQYIALRREQCRLTKLVVGPGGKSDYVPDLDESGNVKVGPITHSYSIASAPFETREDGHLEFYVVLERDERGWQGRLSGSMFRIRPGTDDRISYVNRIVGDFTLAKRARGFRSVCWVGTGTGLAPFVSMVKHLDFEASRGITDGVQYTLLHTNRTYEELAYHEALVAIEKARRFDFVYVPSVSRPTARDFADPTIGRGRANNLLRHIFGMALKEDEDLADAISRRESQSELPGPPERGDIARARAALANTVAPELPKQHSREELKKRLDPATTAILTCGNASLMADIKHIADRQGIRFEKEDW
jgi:ferredoxin-NADP reductase